MHTKYTKNILTVNIIMSYNCASSFIFESVFTVSVQPCFCTDLVFHKAVNSYSLGLRSHLNAVVVKDN